MAYIESVSQTGRAWLREPGFQTYDGADVLFVRCPHCGALYGFQNGATMPDKCHACEGIVDEGEHKVDL